MSHDSRVAALDGLLEDAGLDAVLATKDASIAYLTGFWGLQMERFFGVAVKRGGAGALIAPSLDRDSVAAAPTGLDQDALQRRRLQRPAELFATLDGAKRIGVEEDHLNFARSQALHRGRLRARPRDRADHAPARGQGRRGDRGRPARACAHIEAVYDEVWGRAEGRRYRGRDQRARRRISLARRGAHATPSRTSSSAPTPATRTARPASACCRTATSIVADIAAQFDGYWGDMTRCAHAGSPSDWAAAGLGRSCTRPTTTRSPRRALGNTARDVDAAQREIIEAHPDLGACLHGAGHAIGTEIHEPPFLVPTLRRRRCARA